VIKISNTDELKKPFFVCGLRVDVMEISGVIVAMEEWIRGRSFGNYIVIANANDIVLGRIDPLVREASNQGSLSVPDGISLVLLGRLFGYSLRKRVYGPDLMVEFLQFSEGKGYSHFFYGATDKTLELLLRNLVARFPAIKIAGSYAPPFSPLSKKEDETVIDMINNLKPDVVWVGLGCPKQQLWMYEHKDKLKVPVMVGVGAAFDFLAGVKPQAPRWLRDHGFEWLFRLVTEPKRLWRRYLIDYPLFVCYLLADMVKNRSNSCKS